LITQKIMINWDAHACLPQHPLADFTPVRKLHAAGVNYVSLNVGADMNPCRR
jgi:membrane dipeptidase